MKVAKKNVLLLPNFPVSLSALLGPGKPATFSGSLLDCFLFDLTALISFTIQKCLYPQNCVSDHLFAKIRPFHSDGFATTVLMSDQSRTLAFFPLYYFLYLFQDLLILSPKYLYNWFLFFIPSTSSPVQAQIISFLNHYEVFLLSLCF